MSLPEGFESNWTYLLSPTYRNFFLQAQDELPAVDVLSTWTYYQVWVIFSTKTWTTKFWHPKLMNNSDLLNPHRNQKHVQDMGSQPDLDL